MAHDCYATVHNPERAADWREAIGSDRVPIRSPVATPARLAGHGADLVYEVALDVLTEAQREGLIRVLSRVFGCDLAEVRATIATEGVALLAADCSLTILNPQRWVD
jgi:hypothetical protein